VPIAVVGPRDPGLVFGAELSLSEVAKLIATQSTVDHRVSVVDNEGQVILGDGTGAESLATLGSDATVAFVLPDGTPVRGAIAVVATPDWRVITIEPAAAAEASGSAIRARTAQVLVVSLLLALGVGAVLARSLSEPVRELSDGALRVADGDYGRKVAEDRGDEIGDLQRAFNHMSSRLASGRDEIARQRAEIEGFNRELQARVDERTRELVEAQVRLVQSGQLAAVAEMGAGLAHELNNPIAAILGTAQVVRMRLRGTPEEERVARIEEQATRCREVVASMLRLSEGSSEGGNEPGSVDVVDLRGMLAEVAALVAAPFRQRGVTLVVESTGQAVSASANPVATSRVLAQVLQSFRSGLPDGARLVVRAAVIDGRAAVLFEPDRPVAKGSARDDWMASGLSLWVARRQLETMNGRLDEPGTGQTAWVLSLPGGAA
jgi:signal transduction histidine kinase